MDFESDRSGDEEDAPLRSLQLQDFLINPDWPRTALETLETQMNDTSEPNTQDIVPCGPGLINSLKARQLDPNVLRPRLPDGRHWRRLYTDAVLIKALVQLAADDARLRVPTESKTKGADEPASWIEVIGLLDLAIILAGAPGEGRLELVHSCLSYIHHNHLTPSDYRAPTLNSQPSRPPPIMVPPLLSHPVSKIEFLPSFSTFPSLAKQAFMIPGFAKDWPAVQRWKSRVYLLECAGVGRVVPIERGGDYRKEDWGVDIMPWDSFLDRIGWGERETTVDSEQLYLAQHSLFTQFPRLRSDIFVPDYVYTTPHPSPAYSGPPGNDDQLVINAWCGGQGANSPAHTDPYYNIYVQVVGYKHVWLSPPEATPGMYVYDGASDLGTKAGRDLKREGMLGNTSSVDVFALSAGDPCSGEYPLFREHALPLASSTILSPGDALVIPPGWWHAMRGCSAGSFSVSFWF